MGNPGKPCPHCGKPAAWEDNPFRPFCSERCRLIDLGNWATERYRIPTSQAPDRDASAEGDDTSGDAAGKKEQP